MYLSRTMSRQQILDIVRSHLPKSNRLEAVLRLQRLIGEVDYQKAHEKSVYSYSKRKLVTKEKIGGYWAQQGRQRRWKNRFAPSKSRGRSAQAWRRALICFLGREFYAGTGRPPTRGTTNGSPSRFQQFAEPFLTAFQVQDQEGLVREYIRERRKGNPYGFH